MAENMALKDAHHCIVCHGLGMLSSGGAERAVSLVIVLLNRLVC